MERREVLFRSAVLYSTNAQPQTLTAPKYAQVQVCFGLLSAATGGPGALACIVIGGAAGYYAGVLPDRIKVPTSAKKADPGTCLYQCDVTIRAIHLPDAVA